MNWDYTKWWLVGFFGGLIVLGAIGIFIFYVATMILGVPAPCELPPLK